MTLILAKTRLRATEDDPVDELIEDNGTSFDTMIDGDPSKEEPVVQKLTHDDGGVETPEEKHLLMDDLQTLDYPTEVSSGKAKK